MDGIIFYREVPWKFSSGKVVTTCLLGRSTAATRLNATKGGVSSVCEPLPPDRPLWFPGSSPPEWLDGRFKLILTKSNLFIYLFMLSL